MSFESLNQLSATTIGGGMYTPRRRKATTRPSSMPCTQCSLSRHGAPGLWMVPRSRERPRHLPHIQQGLRAVIKADVQSLFCYPYPRKSMGGHAKALLEVPDPYRVKP